MKKILLILYHRIEDREGIQKLAVGTARCSRYKVNFWNAFCFYPEESEEFPDIPDF